MLTIKIVVNVHTMQQNVILVLAHNVPRTQSQEHALKLLERRRPHDSVFSAELCMLVSGGLGSDLPNVYV